ncbi:MAG: hypothetical protein K6A98_04980 [Prevotella sp.]|jgi:hypothetical protein|nr:hypothetical protein [Prevotella sp.]MCR5152491.1 hypothetical protein [Prevotella sp.]
MSRYAAHRVIGGSNTIANGVVEITGGRVTNIYPLHGEQHSTVWLPGEIIVRTDSEGVKRAYYNNEILT